MGVFLYSRGNGNEGDFPRALVELKDDDSQFAALRALVMNDFQQKSRNRRHLMKHMDVDGEGGEFGVYATCHEGPDGEKDMDAAWLTAELKPLTPERVEYWRSRDSVKYHPHPIRSVLDEAALRSFRSWNRQESLAVAA